MHDVHAFPCIATAMRACGPSVVRSLAPAALLRTAPFGATLSRASLFRTALARNLGAGLARVAQADGDCLFAALHFGVATLAALERARFALVHRALHALAGGLAVLATRRLSLGGHASLSAYG